MTIKRIGLLTGGGDCPGLNAVIRAVTKAATRTHDWEVWGIEDGFLGLIRNRMRRLTSADVSNILTRGGTILGTSNKANPSKFSVGTDDLGEPIYEDVSDRVMEHIAERKLDALVVVGGDGSMSGAADLVKRGIPCVGIPKTIDNDLMHTDLTFGFLTAMEICAEALDRIHTTAASHHRIMLVETMGRNSGWLALYSGMASGADVILIPEIPYDIGLICETCKDRMHEGKSATIIAISEGAKPKDGQQVVSQIVKDSPDPIRLGGVSEVLARQLAMCSHQETRATILGHVQRGGTPCPADRVLATEFALAAINLLATGNMNRIVVQQQGKITSVPITDVANQQRIVPADHHLLMAARAIGVSFGDAV